MRPFVSLIWLPPKITRRLRENPKNIRYGNVSWRHWQGLCKFLWRNELKTTNFQPGIVRYLIATLLRKESRERKWRLSCAKVTGWHSYGAYCHLLYGRLQMDSSWATEWCSPIFGQWNCITIVSFQACFYKIFIQVVRIFFGFSSKRTSTLIARGLWSYIPLYYFVYSIAFSPSFFVPLNCTPYYCFFFLWLGLVTWFLNLQCFCWSIMEPLFWAISFAAFHLVMQPFNSVSSHWAL